MRRRVLNVLVPIITIGALATGCGGTDSSQTTDSADNTVELNDEEVPKTDSANDKEGSGDVIEITYTSRGNADEIKVYQQAIDAFNESQDEIHVTFEASPSDGYNQQLITQLAGGTAADVIFVEDTVISQLIGNGTIADMRDFLGTEASYVKEDDFDAGCWGAARNDSGVYGLSVDCNPVVMYYSPAMLKELGLDDPQELFENGEWTWDKFDEICESLKDAGKYGLIQSGDNIRLYNWVFSNGGSIWDGDTYKFDDKAKEALTYVCDRIKDGRFVYGGTLPDGQGEDAMFMSGQVGFIVAGRWLTKTFHSEGIDFDYIPYPSKDGSKYAPAQVCLGYNCVNANSENKEAAMKFVSFYSSTEGQAARIEGVGTSVPSIVTLDDLIKDSGVPQHSNHILEVRKTGWASGDDSCKDVYYPGFSDDIKSVFEDAYINGTDSEEVLAKAEEKAAEIIAESKK